MKIEAFIIKELFASIKYYTEAIKETINLGEDGFADNVKEIAVEIDKALDTFDMMNMQELTKVEDDKRLDYLKHYEKYAYETAGSDHIKMYKAKLYLHIKKTIRDEIKAEDLAAVPNNELYNWIENYTIFNDSPFQKSAVSNEYFRATINVVKDVENQIIEERIKAPQQTLF